MPTLARLRGLSVALLLAPSLALAPDPITIWMAGDSTMAEKQPDKRPETGWGESFGRLFRDGEVRIANRAMNGRSTRTFIAEHRWQAIVDSVQRGDYVFILDPWWNPAVEAQAIGRAHRMGQSQKVFAYRMIARGTVEEKILELQKTKRDLAESIISEDKDFLGKLTREDLEQLLT